MNQTDSPQRPTTTDPETDQLADVEQSAEQGDAEAALSLKEAGGEGEGDVITLPADEEETESPQEESAQEEPATSLEAEEERAETEHSIEADQPQPEPAEGIVDRADSYVAPEPAAEPAEPPAEEAEVSAPAAAAPDEEEVAETSPLSGPGEWYVVHTYAGYENKVKANLRSRINSMQMENKIFDVVIPMEDVMEIKAGKKQVVQKKVFPGYLLVKMVYDNDSWYVVRNTPGVTGFVSSGTGTKPTPLSSREVEKILAVKPEAQKKPEYRLEWEEGDTVRIIAGPFADFQGTIAEINVEQSKLKVLVNIFDRETPVELAFDQVAKA